MTDFSRRKFMVTTGTAIAATTLIGRTARADANSTIRVGVIGVNGRGQSHIAEFSKLPGVEIAVLCDPDMRVAEARAAKFEADHGRKLDTVADMREVFDRKDIDIVTIATPNHWHSLATIWACQAGKDVYVEKPGSRAENNSNVR